MNLRFSKTKKNDLKIVNSQQKKSSDNKTIKAKIIVYIIQHKLVKIHALYLYYIYMSLISTQNI